MHKESDFKHDIIILSLKADYKRFAKDVMRCYKGRARVNDVILSTSFFFFLFVSSFFLLPSFFSFSF